jgi:hypothetical protein
MSDNIYNSQLNDINDKIKSVSNVLQHPYGAAVLERQSEMNNIIQSEKLRLENKQHSIELATTSQNRLITLNENYNKKFTEYIKMIISITIALAIIAIVTFFKLPSSIIIIVSIIVLSIALIYIITIYSSISSRDNIYFDELKYDTVESTNSSNLNQLPQGVVAANINSICQGRDCCSTSDVWDATILKCIPKP